MLSQGHVGSGLEVASRVRDCAGSDLISPVTVSDQRRSEAESITRATIRHAPRVVQPDAARRHRHRRCSADLVAGLAPSTRDRRLRRRSGTPAARSGDHRSIGARIPLATSAAAVRPDPSISSATRRITITSGPTSSDIPGLVVLHDAHLHHARAACLLRDTASRGLSRRVRVRTIREAPPAAGRAGGRRIRQPPHYAWPMTRLVVAPRQGRGRAYARARPNACATNRPGARVEPSGSGTATPVSAAEAAALGAATRARASASARTRFVFGCFGGLTPDKRLSQVLDAFAAHRDHMCRRRTCCSPEASRQHFDVRPRIDALRPARLLHSHRISRDRRRADGCVAACGRRR